LAASSSVVLVSTFFPTFLADSRATVKSPRCDHRRRLALHNSVDRPSQQKPCIKGDIEVARQRSLEERAHEGRDQGDTASGCRLLRHPFPESIPSETREAFKEVEGQ
jgi:hypothetical protein